MLIGNTYFDTENHCSIMGILNVTPDSFSDGGKWQHIDAALHHVEEMIIEGADVIDIGGESTRPGHIKITDMMEIERIAPIIDAVAKRFEVPISVDTYKSTVAQAAIEAGAQLVNDIWGLKADGKMGAVIAESCVSCVLMHNRHQAQYGQFLDDFMTDMAESVSLAKESGIADNRIMLDPGVGFAKTHPMNLTVINQLDKLRALGYPVLLGASRKSVIGLTLDLPVTQRLEGTLATTVIAVLRGCSFVRVHDVAANKKVITMTESIIGRA